jgi:hypothetical protein
MSLQALPRRRVASPPLIPAAEIDPLLAVRPRLWPNLPAETQAQIALILAELLRRMLPTKVAPRREMSRVDRRERR